MTNKPNNKVDKVKDYRADQKVICTITLEDHGQDFVELDVLANGVLLGNSIMFSHGRISLLGIGNTNGKRYYTAEDVLKAFDATPLEGLSVYLRNTGEVEPLPWKADTLNYKVVGVKKAVKPNRFL